MKVIAILLVLFGAFVLVFGGFNIRGKKTVLDVGPIHATETTHHEYPVPRLIGGLAVAGGVVLLAMRSRRTA